MKLTRFLYFLTGVVLLIGAARLLILYSDRHSDDQKVLIEKSKQ